MAAITTALRVSHERAGGALLDSVLEVINKARRGLKMTPIYELPRGVPEKSRLCVLARALKFEVLLDEEDAPFALIPEYRKASMLAKAWRVARPREAWNGWSVALPSELSGFVREFDAQRHPELIMRDVRAQLHAARMELQSLRLRRRELRSLRLRAARARARTSVLIAQGREICLHSMEACASARRITNAAGFDLSTTVRRPHTTASVDDHRKDAAPACHPSLLGGLYNPAATIKRPFGLSVGVSAAQLGL